MKKQAKTTTKFWPKNKFLVIAIIVLVLILGWFGATYGVSKVRYYNDAANQASMTQMRELILLAVRGVKKTAPVDSRTGDVYFPEAKMYLPNPSTALLLTYLYDKGNVADSQSELSVSTYPVRGTERMYIAKNATELWDAVPHLQACSRGIKIVRQKFPASDTQNVLRQTVHLNNGQDMYVYFEKDCPELASTADLFTNLKAY